MEKSVTTPDQYPLTLNALVNACNQKSSRMPVLSLSTGEVQRAANQLQDQQLVVVEENFRSNARADKYSQRFCGTAFGEYDFDPAQFAVICVLMLRGPQTPGELRTRTARLFEFSDNQAVRDTLDSLIHRSGGAVVAQLAKQPGRQDHGYVHLFGAAKLPSVPASADEPPSVQSVKPGVDRLTQLEQRVENLEASLATVLSKISQ